ncbi:MAG: hypothetical protein KBT01_01240 [Clostridiales bacterium]|nr:hypothetical protein [Candidatus Blautia equi]
MGRAEAMENYRRFSTTGQSELKLNCALLGYFDLDEVTEAERAEYEKYLKFRVRPASEKIVRMDDTEKLQKLYELGGFTEQQIRVLMGIAGEEGRLSSLAWLLRLKKQNYGYQDKDFSL